MLDERKLAVLRAIVDEYVSTSEPVGSKAIADRHALGVSPATIRNDMAALEDEGYITAPHTSAGRVPTDAGYRLFVDRLSSVKPMSAAEKRAIAEFLSGAVDLDDVMTRTVRLLAQATHQVALVQYPSLTRTTVRHVEFVQLSNTRLMIVVILDTGRVEQRVVECPTSISETLIGDLRSRINTSLVGRRLTEVPGLVEEFTTAFAVGERPTVTVVVASLLEMAVERHEERVVIAGAANLTRYGGDFHQRMQPVLEALEEQVVLLRLLGDVADGGDTSVKVRIGAENRVEGLHDTSTVTAGYGGDGAGAVATLGVVGPTRMDYPGTMTSVLAVARYVGRLLAES